MYIATHSNDTFEKHLERNTFPIIRIMVRVLLLFIATATTATTVAINATTTTNNDDVKHEYVRSLYFVHEQDETLRSTQAKEVNKVPWRGLRGSTSSQQPEVPHEVSHNEPQDVVHEIPPEAVTVNDKDITAIGPQPMGTPDDQDAFKRGGIAVTPRPKRHHHHQRVLTDAAAGGAHPKSHGVISSLSSLGRTDDNTNPSPCLFNTCYGHTCDHLVDTWTGVSCDDLVYLYECDCSGKTTTPLIAYHDLIYTLI